MRNMSSLSASTMAATRSSRRASCLPQRSADRSAAAIPQGCASKASARSVVNTGLHPPTQKLLDFAPPHRLVNVQRGPAAGIAGARSLLVALRAGSPRSRACPHCRWRRLGYRRWRRCSHNLKPQMSSFHNAAARRRAPGFGRGNPFGSLVDLSRRNPAIPAASFTNSREGGPRRGTSVGRLRTSATRALANEGHAASGARARQKAMALSRAMSVPGSIRAVQQPAGPGGCPAVATVMVRRGSTTIIRPAFNRFAGKQASLEFQRPPCKSSAPYGQGNSSVWGGIGAHHQNQRRRAPHRDSIGECRQAGVAGLHELRCCTRGGCGSRRQVPMPEKKNPTAQLFSNCRHRRRGRRTSYGCTSPAVQYRLDDPPPKPRLSQPASPNPSLIQKRTRTRRGSGGRVRTAFASLPRTDVAVVHPAVGTGMMTTRWRLPSRSDTTECMLGKSRRRKPAAGG